MSDYLSDRENGPSPRVCEEVSDEAWRGLWALIDSLIDNGSFGIDYPLRCPDIEKAATVGTDRSNFLSGARAEVPTLPEYLGSHELPTTLAALDLVHFCFNHVAAPKERSYHDYFHHHHLTFDRVEGQTRFREQVNDILTRQGLAFELQSDGRIVRLAPPILAEALTGAIFSTGNPELDRMLEIARKKFLSPDAYVRLEALKELWDAWERLKTVTNPADKKLSIGALLDQVAPDAAMRSVLEIEAQAITSIGNNFLIRHSEVNKHPVQTSEHIDYLFHRLFALVQLLLTKL